jgi:poly-gamma-glutamate synthesis protein (capsule biosynthesis protein)
MNRFTTLLLILSSVILILIIFVTSGKPMPDKEATVGQSITQVFNKNIEIILTGDIMLGRSVTITSLDTNKDPLFPFKKVGETLEKADIVFGNLESPLVTDCPRIAHGFTLCADPKMVEGLKYADINVVSLANNHILNFGQKGLEDTKKILTLSGIDSTGYGNLIIKDVKGTKFGFLGFDFTVKVPSQADWDLVKESNSKVDVLIAGVHWGDEYQATANKNQRAWAKLLVENGADVVVGHHPHWVEDAELIDGKPVYYSLGNFVFDQMWSEETKKGLIVRLTFKNGDIIKEEKLPTYIPSLGQPELVN